MTSDYLALLTTCGSRKRLDSDLFEPRVALSKQATDIQRNAGTIENICNLFFSLILHALRIVILNAICFRWNSSAFLILCEVTLLVFTLLKRTKVLKFERFDWYIGMPLWIWLYVTKYVWIKPLYSVYIFVYASKVQVVNGSFPGVCMNYPVLFGSLCIEIGICSMLVTHLQAHFVS